MAATRLALFAAAAFLCASARAQQPDVSAQLRQDIAKAREIKQKPDDWTAVGASSAYQNEKEAAVAFVDLVRGLKDQRMEYCAYILKGPDSHYRFSLVRQGDMNRCPADRPKPAGAVASVHTHPLGGRDSDPSAAGQVFSDGDFAFSESAEMNFPIYLGAPAGHVLKYVPGHTFCKGESFVRRDFEIVRDLKPSVRGNLPVNPGADMPLYDVSGKKLPKPDYCKPLAR